MAFIYPPILQNLFSEYEFVLKRRLYQILLLSLNYNNLFIKYI